MLGWLAKKPIKSEFSLREDDELSRIKAELFSGHRYRPQHRAVELPVLGDGLAWASGLEDRAWAFDQFFDFPNYLDKFTSDDDLNNIGPWVLERRADPFAPKEYENGPILSLNFSLFYGSVNIGLFCIGPMGSSLVAPHMQLRPAMIHVKIRYPLLLPYKEVTGLLHVVSEPFSLDRNGRESDTWQLSVAQAMQCALWESPRIGPLRTSLDFAHFGVTRALWSGGP